MAEKSARHVVTNIMETRGAEAGTAVEPVIVTQFVNFDALPVRGLMRHRLGHHQRLGVALGDEAVVTIIRYQIGGDIEVLL